MKRRRGIRVRAFTAGIAALGALPPLCAAGELLYVSEGNRLHRIDLDSLDAGPLRREIVFPSAQDAPVRGRDINGMICLVPGGDGRFVAGEDTGQPHPPAGWGLLTPGGVQVGKLTASASAEVPDPHGCAFDARGRLFTTETGGQFFGGGDGQLIVWFPPFDGFPGEPGAYPDTDATSASYCKLATDLGTPTGVAVDAAGRVYVAASSGMKVWRFSPPFPTGPDAAGGCGRRDPDGAPRADRVEREVFLGRRWRDGLVNYAGLAFAANGHLYVSSVATGRIAEVDPEGRLVRLVLAPDGLLPPWATGSPLGLAVAAAGDLYYADLDLRPDWREGLAPGPDGKVWRIRFGPDGAPSPPEIVLRGLAFPDGLGILPGDLE